MEGPEVNPGLRLQYVTARDGNRMIVLLRGFPQPWWEWRHVIPIFANAGFRVIAPDCRRAGNSFRPIGGYDKRTLANDIRLPLHETPSAIL
jgi:pimeloyl-ACP methyl ester carboxylesterase